MNGSPRSERGAGALPLVLVLIIVLAGAVFLYSSWHPEADQGTLFEEVEEASLPARAESSVAPPFSLKDVSGKEYSSTRFAGKPTVINFFTTWCPSCREEIPGFVEVYNVYKANGLEMIGIALDGDARALPDFLATYRIGYTVLLGDMSVARAYGGITSVPTTFFIGKDGRIKNILMGYVGREVFEREVRKLL